MGGLRLRHVPSAAAGLRLFFRVGGAARRGPSPGLPARLPPEARCARPPGLPAKVSGTARAARARAWGASGEGARGSRGRSGPPPGRRPVREQKGAGSAVTGVWGAPGRPQARDLGPEEEPCLGGPLSCLSPGRRGREWAGGWGTGCLRSAGSEAADVQVQILELCEGGRRDSCGVISGREMGGGKRSQRNFDRGCTQRSSSWTPRNCA